MKVEFLKGLGLTDEQIQSIQAESGKEIQKHKDDYATLKAENDSQKKLLENANKEISSYKDMDIEGIKKSAEDYKTKYEEAEKEYQAKIAQMEYDSKLDKYLNGCNFKNDIYRKEVVSRIKEKGLKFDGDTLLGGEEVINSFKNEYPDSYNDSKPKPMFADATTGIKNEITKETLNKMSYKDRLAFKNEHPQAYEKLKEE